MWEESERKQERRGKRRRRKGGRAHGRKLVLVYILLDITWFSKIIS